MSKTQYSQEAYERDKLYIRAHDSAPGDIGVLGKLELLTLGNGSQTLYVDHSGLSSKFLAISTAHRVIEHTVVLDNMIKKRHRTTMPNAPMRDEELKQVRDECLAIIHKRVEELFDQRYNGARRRIETYERQLQDPKFQLKELEAALHEGDEERIYAIAERFAIMTRHLDDNHRLIRAYNKLRAAKLNKD